MLMGGLGAARDRVLGPKPLRDTMRYNTNSSSYLSGMGCGARRKYVAWAASTPCLERLGRAAA